MGRENFLPRAAAALLLPLLSSLCRFSLEPNSSFTLAMPFFYCREEEEEEEGDGWMMVVSDMSWKYQYPLQGHDDQGSTLKIGFSCIKKCGGFFLE